MSTQIKHKSSAPPGPAPAAVPPTKLAHLVLRTSRFHEMIAWYKTALAAHTVFENEILCFITYDEEHHRLAFLNVPNLADQPESAAGVHHFAFTYANLSDLMLNYRRLAALGIKPVYVINHGPTSSLYYADPDNNQVELQVENFDTVEDSTAFFYSKEFAENPIGVEFDPEDLLQRLLAGESERDLKKRSNVGARGLADIKLR